ncbi:MAG TPA: histidinol dehydrogenase, partial [Solirubrobacterales bacterium]|nr:histidinol dehydrogenase [Solirubrobacterales bacterium]
MRARRFEWSEAQVVADEIRLWASELSEPVDVAPIGAAVLERGDAAVLELTNRFDATESPLASTAVGLDLAVAALDGLEPPLREALDVAAANVRAVARAQLTPPTPVDLPQGQTVT